MITLDYARPAVASRPTPGPGTPRDEARTQSSASGVTSPGSRMPGFTLGRPAYGSILVVLALAAFVLADVQLPLVRPLAGLALVGGPTALVVARAVRRSLGDPLVALLYGVGAAALGIIVVGLAINTVLPWVGIGHPLDRPTLVVVSALAGVVLVWRHPIGPRPSAARLAALARNVLAVRLDAAITLAVLAVVLSAAGAVRLNNGMSGSVAVLAHATEVAALGVALLGRRSGRGHVPVVYLTSTALLLGTSLRGWYVTGHDIQNEYLSFLYTQRSGHWVMSAYPTPYNACLSVNILPTSLANLTGMSGAYTFKVLLQLLFALVPLCVYVASRRLASPRMALLSAAIFMFFPTFFTDMPYLVRQEVAYLFVALALLTATQNAWTVGQRRAAAFAFGVGVVLSHYSTTYVLIISLVLGLFGVGAGAAARSLQARQVPGLQVLTRRVGASGRPTARLVLLSPIVVTGLVVVSYLWTSPATHSGNHLVSTVRELASSIVHGAPQAGSSDLKYSPFSSSGPSDQQRLGSYARASLRAQRDGDFVFPHPTGTLAHPTLAARPYLPLTGLGRVLADAHVPVHLLNNGLRGLTAALFELFLVIGLVALVLQTRRTRQVGRERFWLVWGSVGALAAVVLVPGLSADYGVLRAFQQTLLFASPFIAVGVVTALSRLGRAAFPVATVTVLGIGLVLTGVQPALLGGYYGQLSQSNAGQYYDLLYVAPPEISADQWLAGATAGDQMQYVAASDIVSVTRLQQYLGRNVIVDANFFPSQLQRGSFVFLEPQTVNEQQATIFYTGDLLTYHYPVGALDTKLDLVYSSDGVRIYR